MSWPRVALCTALMYGAELIIGLSLAHCLVIGGTVIGALVIDRY